MKILKLLSGIFHGGTSPGAIFCCNICNSNYYVDKSMYFNLCFKTKSFNERSLIKHKQNNYHQNFP